MFFVVCVFRGTQVALLFVPFLIYLVLFIAIPIFVVLCTIVLVLILIFRFVFVLALFVGVDLLVFWPNPGDTPFLSSTSVIAPIVVSTSSTC